MSDCNPNSNPITTVLGALSTFVTGSVTPTPPTNATVPLASPSIATDTTSSNVQRRSSMGIKYKSKKQRTEERSQNDNNDEENMDDVCAICYSEMTLPFRTSCSHSFCFLCLKALCTSQYDYTTNTTRIKGTCPLCRADINMDELERAAKVEQNVFVEDLEGDWVWKYSGRNSGFWLFEPQYYEELETKYRAFLQWQQDERKQQVQDLLTQHLQQQQLQQNQQPNGTSTTSTSDGLSCDPTQNDATKAPSSNSVIPVPVDADNDITPSYPVNSQVFVQLTSLTPSQTLPAPMGGVPVIASGDETDATSTNQTDVPTIDQTAMNDTDTSFPAVAASSDVKITLDESSSDVTNSLKTAVDVDAPSATDTTTVASISTATTADTDAITAQSNQDDEDGTDRDHDEDEDDHSDYDEEDEEDDEDAVQYLANLRTQREEAEKKRKEEFLKQRYCQLHIGAKVYIVDFIDMVQYPIDNASLRRTVKREPKVSASDQTTKGVSGVTFINRQLHFNSGRRTTHQSTQQPIISTPPASPLNASAASVAPTVNAQYDPAAITDAQTSLNSQ